MQRNIIWLLEGSLLVILMQGCENSNGPDIDLNTQILGKWMLTQTSAKGEFQMLIPCYNYDSTFKVDTSFAAFEGDYLEFKPGNSYQLSLTTGFDFLSYCSEFGATEASPSGTRGRPRTLMKTGAFSSGQWWINGTELFLTSAFEIGLVPPDTARYSITILENLLTMKGPFRLNKEYQEQSFSVIGTFEVVISARKL